MALLATLSLPLLGLLVSPAAADSSDLGAYSRMFPGGMHDTFDFIQGGLNALPMVDYSIAQWKFGMLPQVCRDGENSADNVTSYCSPDKYNVYDITYDDCQQPWTVCQCQDSPMTVDEIARGLGKLPIKVREYVRFTRFYSGDVGQGAFTFGDDITFFGNYNDSQSVFVHESSHNLDRWVAGTDETWFSSTDEWKNVVSADSCVPDDYAGTSVTEDFAQIGVMIAYDANIKSVWTLDNTTNCMFQQFQTESKHIYENWRYNASLTCDNRLDQATSPPVCVSDAANAAGQCNGVEYVDGQKLRARSPEQDGIRVLKNKIRPEHQATHDAIVAELKSHTSLDSHHVHSHGHAAKPKPDAVAGSSSSRSHSAATTHSEPRSAAGPNAEINILPNHITAENQAAADAIVAEMMSHTSIHKSGSKARRAFRG